MKYQAGQKFIDLKTNQLCRKLFKNYVDLAEIIYQSEEGEGKLVLEKIQYYNAVVESSGSITYISPERQVQVFL